MYVTGHDTVVSWACQGPDPLVKNVEPVDAQGYAKSFWQAVSRTIGTFTFGRPADRPCSGSGL
jgi:hypothetical protein